MSTFKPDGTSTEQIGLYVSLISEMIEANGSLISPLNEKPNIESTIKSNFLLGTFSTISISFAMH